MSTTTQPPVVPAVHKVHGLATVSAVISCIGLLVGNLIGLILSIIALRDMDKAPVRYHGYRMVFTGWFMGLIGLVAYPILLLRAFKAHESGDLAGAVGLIIAVLVLGPAIMLVYAWQDRLPEAETFEGYVWLGKQGKSHMLDLPLGALLIVAGLLIIAKIGPGNLYAAVPFIILGVTGPLFRRRGMRALMGFVIAAYLIQWIIQLLLR